MRSFATKELFNHSIAEMKGEVADMLFLPSFFLFLFLMLLRFVVFSGPWCVGFIVADSTTKMVMELQN